jgi:hypothetical protein
MVAFRTARFGRGLRHGRRIARWKAIGKFAIKTIIKLLLLNLAGAFSSLVIEIPRLCVLGRFGQWFCCHDYAPLARLAAKERA